MGARTHTHTHTHTCTHTHAHAHTHTHTRTYTHTRPHTRTHAHAHTHTHTHTHTHSDTILRSSPVETGGVRCAVGVVLPAVSGAHPFPAETESTSLLSLGPVRPLREFFRLIHSGTAGLTILSGYRRNSSVGAAKLCRCQLHICSCSRDLQPHNLHIAATNLVSIL